MLTTGYETGMTAGQPYATSSPSLANMSLQDQYYQQLIDNMNKQPTMMDNAGQALGLVGGVASLADLLNNWGVAKKATETNIANVKQQMGNNQKAFDRSVLRQDNTLNAIQQANEQARINAGV